MTLNSTQFNVARAAGPMVDDLLIGTVGTGLCFLINALSFVAELAALLAISSGDETSAGAREERPGFRE